VTTTIFANCCKSRNQNASCLPKQQLPNGSLLFLFQQQWDDVYTTQGPSIPTCHASPGTFLGSPQKKGKRPLYVQVTKHAAQPTHRARQQLAPLTNVTSSVLLAAHKAFRTHTHTVTLSHRSAVICEITLPAAFVRRWNLKTNVVQQVARRVSTSHPCAAKGG